MTLDELIEGLTAARAAAPADLPLRVVVRRGELADQHSVMDLAKCDGLHGEIVLLFAGNVAAEMYWPTPDR